MSQIANFFFRWDEAAIALLRAKHAEGATYRQIRDALAAAFPGNGKLSRNACIGRAHRMGLKSDNVPKAYQPRPPRETRAKADPVAQPPKPAARQPAPYPLEPPRQPIEDQVAEIIFAPGPGGLTFMQQKDGFCRWPISKATDFRSFRVCGCLCQMTRPYCDEHSKKAYVPPRPRPAKPERTNRPQLSELFFKDWV